MVPSLQEDDKVVIGLDGAGPVSRLCVSWVNSLMVLGNKRRLEAEDLEGYLPRDLDCVKNGLELEQNWTSFIRTLYRVMKSDFWWCVPWFLLLTAAGVSIPFLIRGYLKELSGSEDGQDVWMFVGLMILLGTIQAFAINYGFLLGSIMSIKARNALTHMIFRKAVRLRSSTSGGIEVLNLMSSDCERIFTAGFVLHSSWWSVLMIVLVLVLLCSQIGVAGVGTIVVMLCAAPMNTFLARRLGAKKLQMLKRTDARVSLSGEVVLGIQTVKMLSWEDTMKHRMEDLRREEMVQGGSVLRLMALNAWQTFALPPVMAATCFVILATSGDPNALNVAVIYSVLAFLSALDTPLNFIPRATSAFAQAKVSIGRVEAFMALPEFDPKRLSFENNGKEDDGNVMVRLDKVSLFHPNNNNNNDGDNGQEKQKKQVEDEEEGLEQPPSPAINNVLSDVCLDIKRGELIVVVGAVGSGKTSLLCGLLGEMGVSSGKIQYRFPDSTLAYVPQEPWILNTSMRENVLFGKEYDEQVYQQVLTSMQMRADIGMLPNKDATEIGSRGINLSGGQKARVGMARAVYHALQSEDRNELLVLCDDPFSALDPNLAVLVWRDTVEGLLGKHTRVVCLNSNLALAKNADRIVVLEQGLVAAVGTPREILGDTRFAWLFDKRQATEQTVTEPIAAAVAAIPTAVPTATVPASAAQQENTGQLYRAEERALGSVTLKTYKNWFKAGAFFNTGYCLTASVLLVLYATTQGLKVFADLFLGMWTAAGAEDMGFGLGVYFAAIGAMLGFSLARTMTFVTVCRTASVRLHDQFVDHLLEAPVNLFFDITPTGRILNRMSNDLDNIDARLPEVALNLLHNSFQILGAITMAIYANPFILLLLAPVTLAFAYIATILSRTQRELKRLDATSRSPLFSHFAETIQGSTSIRAFKASDRFIAHNGKLSNENTTYYLMFWLTSRWFALRVDMMAVFIQFCILSLNVASSRNAQNPAIVGLAVTYSLMLTTTVQAATRNFVETSNSMIACERICDFIENVPLERRDGRSDFVMTQGKVEFRNVSTRYRPNLDLCVRNVSFTVEGGQKLGICGRSGASKSTLGNLLFGMLAAEGGGDIYFDGVASKSISLHCLRSQLSVIPQQPIVFSGTIRFALDPCGEVESDAVLWEALRQVQLERFVQNLPDKLDGKVEENAAQFSVGERQLLCIARALLRRSKVVLLDESTSSIDSQSDQIVQQSIKDGFKQSTIFVIAHRLHTIVDCDMIAVMSHGELKEFAPPAVLLSNPDGMFREMWDLEKH